MQRFDGKGFYQIDENATTLKDKKKLLEKSYKK